jgi:polycystin 1L2
LTNIKVWHDNSGFGSKASWYLKHVIIHDLQTREKYYFICEDWLAVDKSDGLINRLIPVAGEAQKSQFKYLLRKQAKQKLTDGHLWFSIFARPVQSSFNRLDRLTCGFVLLCISMLMNILYYGTDKSSSPNGLKIGPFNFTPQQISIGIITNLIVFPPSFLLVQLFRRSKRRETRITKLRNTLLGIQSKSMFSANESSDKYKVERCNNEKKKQKKELKFPWWTKIIAYVLSFVFAAVSIFFIIMQGISFGDDKCTKWLTSIMVSFITSILLTQPIQVALVALFFVTICRKSDEKNDLEADEDDGKGLNKWKRPEYLKDLNELSQTNMIDDYTTESLRELKKKEIKRKRSKQLLRELVFNAMFLSTLFAVSYSNKDMNSFKYKQSIENTFKSHENVRPITSVLTI